MIIRGTIRSKQTWESEAEARDPEEAKNTLREQLPADFEIDRFTTVASKAGQPSRLKAIAYSTLRRELEASGPDYPAARAAYLEQIPEGWLSLGVRVDD